MNFILAQAADPRLNFWSGENDSTGLKVKIGIALVLGFAVMAGLMALPSQFRRPVVVTATFVAGLIYIAYWLWPQPIARQAGTLPSGPVETVGFFLDDAQNTVGGFYNILAAFMLGLGVYSILRIHVRRFVKGQQDWAFSLVLLISMLVMLVFGYWDWINHFDQARATSWENVSALPLNNKIYDILFEGTLQQMDAAMFSIIAFYILSAAYRAFRIRSVEATIMLSTALILMLSLMGAVAFLWDGGVSSLAQNDPNSFINNFKLSEISAWLRDTFQTSGLRGIDFGVGIGALAMGMRLWLSLERGGVSQ